MKLVKKPTLSLKVLALHCLFSVQSCFSMASSCRFMFYVPTKRRCCIRSNNCLRKMVVFAILFVVLPIVIILRSVSVENTIVHIPMELDPVLQGLPTSAKRYVINYKNVCESFVLASTHGSRHDFHNLASENNQFQIEPSASNWTRRKVLSRVSERILSVLTRNSSIFKELRQNNAAPRLWRSVELPLGKSMAQTSAALLEGDKNRGKVYCPCVSPGKLNLERDALPEYMALSWEHIESHIKHQNVNVSLGGVGTPSECLPRQRVAIIIPYRDREEHLKAFLAVMHPFLQRQHLHYQIFVIEQHSPSIFNRASLMNIGFLEAKRQGPFDCYIYQDVDLLPETDLNFYTCYSSPLHIGAYMNKFEYKMPYPEFFGGAMAMTPEQVEAINGFPNRFFGWGGEDDDIYMRVQQRQMKIQKHPLEIGRTYMIKHEQDKLNPSNPLRFKFIQQQPNLEDGLSTIQYKRHKVVNNKLYTWVLASIERQYDEQCVIDPSLPHTAEGNYLNCYLEENFINWSLDCCHDNVTVFCCNKTNITEYNFRQNTVMDYQNDLRQRHRSAVVFNIILPCVVVSLLLFCGPVIWRKRQVICLIVREKIVIARSYTYTVFDHVDIER